MCGIWGVFAENERGISDWQRTNFKALYALNARRGSLGLGMYDGEEVRRFPDVNYDQQLVDIFAHEHPNVKMLLGHSRAPTNGGKGVLAETHPIEFGNLLLAHNGILFNHVELAYKLTAGQQRFEDPGHTLDSIVLTRWLYSAIERELGNIDIDVWHSKPKKYLHMYADCIEKALREVKGSFACWMYDKRRDCATLFCNISPLFVACAIGGYYVFSSEYFEGSAPLANGSIRCYNFSTREAVGRIASLYSPYDIHG